MVEMLMLSLCVAFFIVEYLELNDKDLRKDNYGRQEHLLGWAVFLTWMDLTLFLGRFDIFGRHIYRSSHVFKNVVWSLIVYVPVLVAFAFAFHCFLKYDPVFEGNLLIQVQWCAIEFCTPLVNDYGNGGTKNLT